MTRKMYDSVNPDAIPTNAQMVAGYIDGTNYKWPESAWARFPNSVKVRIARRTTTNDGHVLDVEYGIPTVWPPSQAVVDWVIMRRKAGVEPTIYCNQLNDWSGIRQLFQNAGVKEPYYWVARYNNIDVIPAGAIAKQYANSTLAGGNYDLSVVADYWPGVDGEVVTDMTFEGTDRDKLNQIYDQIAEHFTYSGGTGVGWSFDRLFDFFKDDGGLKQLNDKLDRVAVGNVDLDLLVTKLADELDRRARDSNPATGPTS
jgi:hypothetical protein